MHVESGSRRNSTGSQSSVKISGNLVGVFGYPNGTYIKVPNANGIVLENVKDALVGGTITPKNIIAGNAGVGVLVEGEQSLDNVINSSLIGRSESGAAVIGNGSDGIKIVNATRTVVGDTNYFLRNNIGWNGGAGVRIEGPSATLNKVSGNLIGFTPNQGHGVVISGGAHGNQIGGLNNNDEINYIAQSGGAGIRIDETAGNSNLACRNNIFGSPGREIDIGLPGRTPNDAGDPDEGANRGQNFPKITSSQIVNNELIVSFYVDSFPGNSNYGTSGLYIEFFKADNLGRGAVYLGSSYYTVTNHNGNLPGLKTVNLGNVVILGFTASDLVTATATDADGNTSELFPPVGPSAAGVEVSGRVLSADGRGVRNATVTITGESGVARTTVTGRNGTYTFDDVEAGRTYTLGVLSRRYSFASRVVEITDNVGNLDFIAESPD